MTVKDESYKQIKQRNCIVEIGNSFEEDITPYVMSIDINHTLNGDTYLINEINPSTSGLMVKNYNDYFKNKQLSKLPIRIKSGYNGLNDEVFRGYLKRDSYRVGSKELSLSSESYLQVFKKPIINKEILENYFIEDIIKRAIEECVTDGTPYELQKTGIRIPICNLNKYENWSSLILLLIPASQHVLIYEDGKFRFRKFWDSSLPSVYSFNVDNIKELVQTKSQDDIKNTILLVSNYESVSPKDKLSENLVNQCPIENEPYYIQEGYNNRIKVQNYPLYKDMELVDGEYKYKTDTTVFIVDENSSRFGERVLINDLDVDNGYIYLAENLPTGTKLSVSYKYLQLQLNPSQERQYIIELNNEAKNIQLLVAAWKNTGQFDTGERVPYSSIPSVGTIHLTDVIEQKDNKIKFKLKNNTDSIITISTLQAYGNPIKAFSPIKAKYKNPLSVSKYGEKVLEINNDFIVSEQQARDLGVFLYSNCSDLIEKIEVLLPQHMPFLKIGDKVTVTENSTSIDYDFMITSIKHSYNENEWSTSFNAIKYPVLLEDVVPEYLTKDNQGDYITSTLFNDAPLPTPSNLKVQYNNNTDGTKNISLSWADIDDIQSPRDGYEIFISTKNQSGNYTVDFQNDIHFQIKPEARALILRNLPFKETIDSTDFFKYYAFAIRPFRNIHPEISPDKTGILLGSITSFTSTFSKIDDFILYNGSTIEDSVNGVIETTSISILNTMLNAVKKNETYANSLSINDFKGMTVALDGIDRVIMGQYAPNKFGLHGRDGNGDEVFRLDGEGLKMTGNLNMLGGYITWNSVNKPTRDELGNWTTYLTDDGIYTGTLTANQINTGTLNVGSGGINLQGSLNIGGNLNLSGSLKVDDLSLTDMITNTVKGLNSGLYSGLLDGQKVIKPYSITATEINATNLHVSAANITGKLTANQIDTNIAQVNQSLQIGNADSANKQIRMYTSSGSYAYISAYNSYGFPGINISASDILLGDNIQIQSGTTYFYNTVDFSDCTIEWGLNNPSGHTHNSSFGFSAGYINMYGDITFQSGSLDMYYEDIERIGSAIFNYNSSLPSGTGGKLCYGSRNGISGLYFYSSGQWYRLSMTAA